MDPLALIPAFDLGDDLDLDIDVVQKMATSDVHTCIVQNSSSFACPYFHFGRFLGECRDAQFWAMGRIVGTTGASTTLF